MSGRDEPPILEAEIVPDGPPLGQRLWRTLASFVRVMMWAAVGAVLFLVLAASVGGLIAKQPHPAVCLAGVAAAVVGLVFLAALYSQRDDSALQIQALTAQVASLEKAREKDAAKIKDLKEKSLPPPLPVPAEGDAQRLRNSLAQQLNQIERLHQTNQEKEREIAELREYVKQFAPPGYAQPDKAAPAAEDRAEKPERDKEQLRRQFEKREKEMHRALLRGGLRLAARVKEPQPGYLLRQSFCSYRDDSFLNLALQSGGSQKLLDWQATLTEVVFVRGAGNLLAALVERPVPTSAPADDEAERLVCEARDKAMARLRIARSKANTANATEDNSAVVADTVAEGLLLAWDLLTSPTPGWLILPERGDPFDAALHEAAGGAPAASARIDKVVFPGYVQRGTPDMVEKAKVMLESGGA